MGLDPPTTVALSSILRRLAKSSSPRLLLALRTQDPIPDWVTHVLYLGKDLTITHQGPFMDVNRTLMREADMSAPATESSNSQFERFYVSLSEFGRCLTDDGITPNPEQLPSRERKGYYRARSRYDSGDRSMDTLSSLHLGSLASKERKKVPAKSLTRPTLPVGEVVLEMNGVTVKYGDRVVLGAWDHQIHMSDEKDVEIAEGNEADTRTGLWWRVHRGERWAVVGPNGSVSVNIGCFLADHPQGSGKTTLLSLLLSDHPQSYSAPMRVFGRTRLPSLGQPGLSLFDIQSQIGHSSPEVHSFFPRNLTVRQTLESAYADTPRSRPKLTVEADARIDACLRWFQGELHPSLGMNSVLKREMLGDAHIEMPQDTQQYGKWQQRHERWYEHYVSQADAVEWADEMLFGSLTFSAQRVALFLRAIVAKPDIVVLDEAFSGMDDIVRDKCMMFLEHGESRRQTPWAERGWRTSSKKIGQRARRRPEMKGNCAISEGLTNTQALIVVSHIKEEIPSAVTRWLYLPESGSGEPCRLGTVGKGRLRKEVQTWDRIWNTGNPTVRRKERAEDTTA